MHMHLSCPGILKLRAINNEENGLKGENYFLFSSLFF
jgi:hypothetical protein